MTVELITGQGGTAHIGSEDVGAYQAYTFGTGRYILHGCEASIIDSNTVRISAGELMVEGRHIRIIGAEDIQIQSGTIGQKRTDLIAVRYTKDGDGIETCVLAAIIGTPSAGQPSEPDYIHGSILDSDIAADFPLFRISIDGFVPLDPVCMFDRAAPFSGRQTLPGVIYPYAGSVAPKGFLMCDGAEYSRVEYPELFAAIGTIYGKGDGSTTFNVPDLKKRIPVGAGGSYTLGDTGGEESHKLTIDEMPIHNHVAGGDLNNATNWSYNLKQEGSNSVVDGNIAYSGWSGTTNWKNQIQHNTGGGGSHNNMQPYTVCNYIIATGKGGGVSVIDIVQGAQALPLPVEYGGTGGLLSIEYGGTGASTADAAREALGATLENFGVNDHVVAEGTSGVWSWRKWESGKAECWCSVSFANLTCETSWGSLYYAPAQYVGDYPFAFTSTPAIFFNTHGGREGFSAVNGYGTATYPPKVFLVRPDKVTTLFDLNVNFRAEGRWK